MTGRSIEKDATRDRIGALEATAEERGRVRTLLTDYMSRTGLTPEDFARRIGYSGVTLRFFLADRYYNAGASDRNIRRAICDFINTHPVEPPQRVSGELYETQNMLTIRETFQKLLVKPVAYMIYAPPGSQKSFVLEHEVARLNREELAKDDCGRLAFFVYCRRNIRPRDLLKDICMACGVPQCNSVSRMISNLRFEFQTRRVLLILDEAQQLSLDCLETVRILLDRPPFFSLLFAGSHDLYRTFEAFSATLEQWNSRIIAKVKLPGLQREEAIGIIQRELGAVLRKLSPSKSDALIDQMIRQSTTKDAFEKGRFYINVRTLTNALDQIRASAVSQEEVCA